MGEARRRRRLAAKETPETVRDNFFKGVQNIVNDFQFTGLSDTGGLCMLKTLVAYQAIRSCNIDVEIALGSMLCRVGPDPQRDVVAFCGPMNKGQIYNNQFAGHCWLYHADMIYDPSVGSWRDLDAVKTEMQAFGHSLGVVQWDVTLPSHWFKPVTDLERPWRPIGTPEIGKAWYGPFVYDIADTVADTANIVEMVRRFSSLQEDIGQQIVTGISNIKREFGRYHGIPYEEEDNTVHPLQFKIRVGPKTSVGDDVFIRLSTAGD